VREWESEWDSGQERWRERLREWGSERGKSPPLLFAFCLLLFPSACSSFHVVDSGHNFDTKSWWGAFLCPESRLCKVTPVILHGVVSPDWTSRESWIRSSPIAFFCPRGGLCSTVMLCSGWAKNNHPDDITEQWYQWNPLKWFFWT
jgi:hypothetical protein